MEGYTSLYGGTGSSSRSKIILCLVVLMAAYVAVEWYHFDEFHPKVSPVKCVTDTNMTEYLDAKKAALPLFASKSQQKSLKVPKTASPELPPPNSHVQQESKVSDLPAKIGFRADISALDWKDFDMVTNQNKTVQIQEYWNQILKILYKYNMQAPFVPINTDCKPPPLPKPESIDCSKYPHAFQGKRKTPVKIAHAIQLGFDVDVLEIHLNEIYDVVDKIFIVEWTKPHHLHMNYKPLTWERLKQQPRFEKFIPKVVHFIMDELDAAELEATKVFGGRFARESFQQKRRWEKIKAWNNYTKFFSEEDLIGFGDADEIASRENINLLKHCKIGAMDKVDIGIWFPYGDLNMAFRNSFQVKGYPYTLGDPTFWTFKKAHSIKPPKAPSRSRGQSKLFLVGGCHMTNYRYLPYKLIKRLTCTECNVHGSDRKKIYEFMKKAVQEGKWDELENEFTEVPYNRLVKISDLDQAKVKKFAYRPWFYQCNKERYPRWEGKHDTRLE